MTYKTYTTNTTYKKFVKRWEEVTDLPPQTVGPLTPFYKAIVRRIKVMPWPILVVSSLFIVISLYVILGSAITLLVSLLQRGF
jgi:hypothetical protein